MHRPRRRRRKPAGAVGLALLALGACADVSVLAPDAADAVPDDPAVRPRSADGPFAVQVVHASIVEQLTGAGSANRTAERWDVHGTDLGHMFWHRGRLHMVFGDTFGAGGLGGRNWRSNTMARLAPQDPRRGLRLESMITGPDGAAKELIPARRIDGVEKSVIPTFGISIAGRMVLHYMSVRRWGGGSGQWEVGHSGLAYSDDDGESWTVSDTALWPAPTGFEQVALLERDDHTYMFGIPGGRFGGVRLRRVASEGILDPGSYEYWDGRDWSPELEAAVTVVPSPVGELSVAWHELHRLWLMTYLNPERRAVMLRTAPELTGPWSEEQVVVTAAEHRGLYAPYFVPVRDSGDDVYFTMSLWGRYNVFLMRMQLAPAPTGVAAEAGSGP